MVGKRRSHKTVVPFRMIRGSGSTDVPALVENLGLTRRRALRKGGTHAGEDEVEDDGEDRGDDVAEGDDRDSGEVVPAQTKGGLQIPLEIIDLVQYYCVKHYPLLFVNKLWCIIAIKHIYAKPELTPHNYFQFVEAITQKGALGSNVKDLDLVKIAQVGERSMTSRLLRRCSPRLERFVAPQANFGHLPMISLAGCHRLKVLDLSLVSETVNLPMLFKAIQNFHDLEVLHFPRSSIECPDDAKMEWAPNLTQLGLSGGFPAAFLERTEFPPSLKQLQISNCPYMTTSSLLSLLVKIGGQLERLIVAYPIRLLATTTMDSVFYLCPNLKTLHVSVDYISKAAFDPDLMPAVHKLQTLYLLSTGMIGLSDKIKPGDILLATDQLPKLKRVSTSLLLGWNPESSALMGLVELMNDRGGGVWMV